ncbi:MAG: hypothetical protein JNL82_40425 [Myxococcales bacterium]|nr:hypothetical protein [Myxococcales bacterium]
MTTRQRPSAARQAAWRRTAASFGRIRSRDHPDDGRTWLSLRDDRHAALLLASIKSYVHVRV